MGVLNVFNLFRKKTIGRSGASEIENLKKESDAHQSGRREASKAPEDGKVLPGSEDGEQTSFEETVFVIRKKRGVSKEVTDGSAVTSTFVGQPVFYTVKSGDTLRKIAEEQYGEGGKKTVIFEANKPLLTSPDKVHPGQILQIPPLQ